MPTSTPPRHFEASPNRGRVLRTMAKKKWPKQMICWCVLVSTLPDLLIRIKSTKKTQLILIFFIAQCTITLLNSLPLSGHSAPAVSGLSLNLLSKGVKLSRGQRGSCCRRMELCRQHAWGPGGENHLHYIFFHVIRLDCVWIAKQRPDLAWIDPNWRIKPLAEVAGVILDGWLDHGQVGTRSTFLASLIKYVIYHIHHTYIWYILGLIKYILYSSKKWCLPRRDCH